MDKHSGAEFSFLTLEKPMLEEIDQTENKSKLTPYSSPQTYLIEVLSRGAGQDRLDAENGSECVTVSNQSVVFSETQKTMRLIVNPMRYTVEPFSTRIL
jgi:hypothetical protein